MATASDESGTPRRRAVRKRATRESVRSTRAGSARARVPRPAAATAETKNSTPVRTRKPVQSAAPVAASTPSSANTGAGRKAPTALASRRAGQAQRRRQQIIVGALLLVGVSASAVVGLSDAGEINIDQAIEARNERVLAGTADERESEGGVVSVPVQNSGPKHTAATLRGRGVGSAPATPPPAPAEVAGTSTGTSSDMSLASSTEAVATTSDIVAENSEPETTPTSDERESEPVADSNPEPAGVSASDATEELLE